MTAKLLIREVGQREFVQHNGDFEDVYDPTDEPDKVVFARTAEDEATRHGERLTTEGNVEAFQVWSLVTTKQRVWKLEEVA